MQHLIIPGGSGFLGLYLANYMASQGWKVTILSRKAKESTNTNIAFVQWDGKKMDDWAKVFEGADAVVNMAGRTVNCRYTDKNKKQILESRIDSTRAIGKAIKIADHPPKVWINSSSATIYEDTRGGAPANNEYVGKIGDDFSMSVCKIWERELGAAQTPYTRKIALRTAIVIAKEKGGAMEYLLNLSKVGLGGTQGDGNQYVSWVHLEDFVRCISFLIDKEHINGVINCAAPNPVTNKVFMASIRQAIGRNWGLSMPEFLLEVGAVMLGTQTELILKSRKVVSLRLSEEGFVFNYPTLEKAMEEIVPKGLVV